MNITINVGNKAVITFAVLAAFFFGTQAAEAASSSTPKVLCVQKSGAVVARATCKSGETKFSVMPGTVSRKAKTVKRLPIALRSLESKVSAVPLSASLSTLSLLSSAPRVYTNLIELPAGFPLDIDGATPIIVDSPLFPSCPSDAPLTLMQSMSVAEQGSLGDFVLGRGVGGNGYIGKKSSTPDEYLYEIDINTKSIDGRMTWEIYGYRQSSWTSTVTERAFRFYLTQVCVPIVDLV